MVEKVVLKPEMLKKIFPNYNIRFRRPIEFKERLTRWGEDGKAERYVWTWEGKDALGHKFIMEFYFAAGDDPKHNGVGLMWKITDKKNRKLQNVSLMFSVCGKFEDAPYATATTSYPFLLMPGHLEEVMGYFLKRPNVMRWMTREKKRKPKQAWIGLILLRKTRFDSQTP